MAVGTGAAGAIGASWRPIVAPATSTARATLSPGSPATATGIGFVMSTFTSAPVVGSTPATVTVPGARSPPRGGAPSPTNATATANTASTAATATGTRGDGNLTTCCTGATSLRPTSASSMR